MCALMTQKSDLCWSEKKEIPYKRALSMSLYNASAQLKA